MIVNRELERIRKEAEVTHVRYSISICWEGFWRATVLERGL
ncbi:hypothetical protein B7P43_G05037 [Cryptotermes secundus]|uniref:Uncharacterized protein n=1 Tax=Cryptotermes secundus TaxID=105785 RepID=A0A2J7PQM1_9NEOP|nr:hypothetical protein B7P43_G05037 [Cryptotermes secundus]